LGQFRVSKQRHYALMDNLCFERWLRWALNRRSKENSRMLR
jgi:hypothetical protein